MAENISLFESVDGRIADRGGVTVVGIPIGTEECVLEHTVGVVMDGGASRLARCLADMPDKLRVLDTDLSLEACRRAENRAQWAFKQIILELRGAPEPQ